MSVDAYSDDRLSGLPDELLENIVSRLPMSEAVATSFLSPKWEHIWKCSSGNFVFGSAALARMKRTRQFTHMKAERERYMNRVHSFFGSHVGPSIDRFKIRFDLRAHSAKDINAWMWLLAVTKRVRRLDLDFSVVNPRSLNKNVFIPNYDIKQCYTLEYFYFGYLTSLKLHTVNMSRETAEYILSCCPMLEYVCIIKSPGLSGVRVTDACLKLKHLKIAHCQNLEFLDISSAPNLTSLSYTGPRKTSLCFWDVPNLVDVSLQGEYCSTIIDKFHELRLPLHQIQKLQLSSSMLSMAQFKKFPELKSVTELELESQIIRERSLLSWAYAIEACPNLSRLLVKLIWWDSPVYRERAEFAKESRNKCLKAVKLSGFRGSPTDIELATYIFSTSPSVERISVYTIDTKYVVATACTDFCENLAAKDVAKQLASRISPAARLRFRCAPMPYTRDNRPPPFPREHLLV